MNAYTALDLNGFVFAMAKMVDNNVRQTFFKVKSGVFMVRTNGYDSVDKYERQMNKEGFQQLNSLFVWNRTFLCWALKEGQINGQKLVDITYHLASAANGKLRQVEMVKSMGDCLVGARGIFSETDYGQTLKSGGLFRQLKHLLAWSPEDNAWLIPSHGKPDLVAKPDKIKSKLFF